MDAVLLAKERARKEAEEKAREARKKQEELEKKAKEDAEIMDDASEVEEQEKAKLDKEREEQRQKEHDERLKQDEAERKRQQEEDKRKQKERDKALDDKDKAPAKSNNNQPNKGTPVNNNTPNPPSDFIPPKRKREDEEDTEDTESVEDKRRKRQEERARKKAERDRNFKEGKGNYTDEQLAKQKERQAKRDARSAKYAEQDAEFDSKVKSFWNGVEAKVAERKQEKELLKGMTKDEKKVYREEKRETRVAHRLLMRRANRVIRRHVKEHNEHVRIKRRGARRLARDFRRGKLKLAGNNELSTVINGIYYNTMTKRFHDRQNGYKMMKNRDVANLKREYAKAFSNIAVQSRNIETYKSDIKKRYSMTEYIGLASNNSHTFAGAYDHILEYGLKWYNHNRVVNNPEMLKVKAQHDAMMYSYFQNVSVAIPRNLNSGLTIQKIFKAKKDEADSVQYITKKYYKLNKDTSREEHDFGITGCQLPDEVITRITLRAIDLRRDNMTMNKVYENDFDRQRAIRKLYKKYLGLEDISNEEQKDMLDSYIDYYTGDDDDYKTVYYLQPEGAESTTIKARNKTDEEIKRYYEDYEL